MFTGSHYFDDQRIKIAAGLVKNVSHIHKFGAVPTLSNAATGTIWDVNDTLYPWSAFATAGTLTVSRADAGDAGKVVTIFGLDENYNEIQESVTLTNPTGNATTQSFIRVYRAFVVSGATNAGLISILKGATTVAAINADKGQTLMCVYTVPAGHTAYLLKGVCSCQNGGDALGDMFVRYGGQDAFRVGHAFEVVGAGGNYQYEFGVPIRIPEKSDIDIRATARTNNIRITAAFDIVLVKE